MEVTVGRPGVEVLSTVSVTTDGIADWVENTVLVGSGAVTVTTGVVECVNAPIIPLIALSIADEDMITLPED